MDNCFKIHFVLIISVVISFMLLSCGESGTSNNIIASYDINDVEILEWKLFDQNNSGLHNSNIYTITIDKQKNIWFGSLDGGISKYDGANWITYNTDNSVLPPGMVWSISVSNNDIWIGTSNGLARFNGQDWEVFNPGNSQLPYRVISALAVDHNNVLWIGCGHATAGGLLSYYNGTWRLFTPNNSALPCSIIHEIYVDENNNKWIGTGEGIGIQGGGLAKIDYQGHMTAYTTENSPVLYHHVDALCEDLYGNLWIGYRALLYLNPGIYYGGLQRYNGGYWKDFSPHPNREYNPEAIVSNRVSDIACDSNGLLWIVTEPEFSYGYNLSVFKDGNWRNVRDIVPDFPHVPIREIKCDEENTIWLATPVGVISLKYQLNEK